MNKKLNITQTAKEVRRTRQTIYNWIGRGLTHEVIGGRVYLDLDDVLSFCNKIHKKGEYKNNGE